MGLSCGCVSWGLPNLSNLPCNKRYLTWLDSNLFLLVRPSACSLISARSLAIRGWSQVFCLTGGKASIIGRVSLRNSMNSFTKSSERKSAIRGSPRLKPSRQKMPAMRPYGCHKTQLLSVSHISLAPLHNSFTQNWKHCSLANLILIHPLPHTSLPLWTPNTINHRCLTIWILTRCLSICSS